MKSGMGDRLREWVSLGSRLLLANPSKYRQVVGIIERIVEGEEVIATARTEASIVRLQHQRTKRYSA